MDKDTAEAASWLQAGNPRRLRICAGNHVPCASVGKRCDREAHDGNREHRISRYGRRRLRRQHQHCTGPRDDERGRRRRWFIGEPPSLAAPLPTSAQADDARQPTTAAPHHTPLRNRSADIGVRSSRSASTGAPPDEKARCLAARAGQQCQSRPRGEHDVRTGDRRGRAVESVPIPRLSVDRCCAGLGLGGIRAQHRRACLRRVVESTNTAK